MKGKTGKKRSSNLLAALCFAVALALLLTSVGATLARYFRTDSGSGVAAAAPFYFTSDKLSDTGDAYIHLDEPGDSGVVPISFALANYVDSLRQTPQDIQYSCWVVTGTDTAAQPLSDTTRDGKLTGGSASRAEISYSLSKSDFGSQRVVTVIAKASSPYEKTLTARFGFDKQEYELQWLVEEEDNAVILRFAGGSGKDVTVTWPSELMADPSNEVLEGASDGSVTFTAKSGVRYALTFFKPDPSKTYTESDFTIEEVEE